MNAATLLARRRNSPRARHLLLAAAATLARAEHHDAAAHRLLERAAAAAEALAARILDEQWRASFWGEWGWPHLELARLELDRGRIEAAFEVLESGRGRSLASGRRSAWSEDLRGWAAGAMKRDRDRSTRSGARLVSLPPPFTEAPAPRLERVLRTVRVPRVRLSDVRRQLPTGGVLLDAVEFDGSLGWFAVDESRVRAAWDLVRVREVAELMHAVTFHLRGASWSADPGPQFGAAEANELSQVVRYRPRDPALEASLEALAAAVLWPAIALLGRIPSHLAITPVAALSRVPWAALPLPDGRRLCEVSELVVVPGLRLGLATARRSAVSAFSAGLLVAVDADGLDHARSEITTLARLFPSAQVLSGSEATAERFMAAASGAAWIHFAGHGVFRAEAPLGSGLRFADRWVTGSELQELRLAARWVTLSACQTARSLVRPGEEWFGLPRALLGAGAGMVLAAAWDVDDAATACFMSEVYRHVAEGESLPGGLQRVQASNVRNASHPLDWAGFMTLGGPGISNLRS
ncbi:MAG: CHAT domain-containing protein [Candidatus Eisenbacteria bacterium]|uniref:CHAT domain-containing protein n=1 Tax=Eiseniibacteriota bacterium TaxID=2212470 RepID=A0A849SFE2_UNCEI|nr:CHAT domain-containing protein [Candidatus Eisenbacteria bacterium]